MTVASDPLHVRFGEFELDQGNVRLLRAGSPVALAPTPFDLLCALARQPGTMLTKHALLDGVWGHRFVSDSVLKGAISDIRNALGDDPRQPRFIETVPRRGYRFVARSVTMQSAAPGAVAAERRRSGTNGLDDATAAGFVGREAELAKLERAWELAQAGRRTLAWVVGEPGIGKTTLIEHFIAGFEDIPARVAVACRPSAPESPTTRCWRRWPSSAAAMISLAPCYVRSRPHGCCSCPGFSYPNLRLQAHAERAR